MSLNKRIKGNFTIETVDPIAIGDGDTITLRPSGYLTNPGVVVIDGDLTVMGDTTTLNTTNTDIVDNTIVLNSGETGAGVSAGTAGIIIDRGTAVNGDAGIRFNETSDIWELKNGDGTGWNAIASGGTGITAIVQDTTPQLGGALDVNGQIITSAAAGDIVIVADTTGLVKIDQELSLVEQAVPTLPDGVALYNKLSAGTIGAGGSGLYFVNDTDTDELVSKKKAIIYGIIF